MLRLTPLLVLLFAGVLYWLGASLKSTLHSAHLEVARASNAMAVYAVEASMITDGIHQPWDRVARRVPRDEGTEIEIINTNGAVLFSTDATKHGEVYRLGESSCSECHVDGSTRATTETAFISRPRDPDQLVFASPLRNVEGCRNCHTSEKQKLGMVLVRQSLGPIHGQIRTIQIGIAVAGGVVLLMTMLTTRLLLGRYLGRPLRRLLAGAREIGAGNLEHQIELPERTELVLLAETLNTSTARLARAQEELVQRERLAAVGETVAGLAHCLKNMLNGLRAGQYVIDRAVELDDRDKLRQGWRVMKNGVGQVEKLTFDMLYYVKEREPVREAIDPNQIVREVVDLLDESASAKGVQLRAELDPEIGVESLDRTLVYRAVLNLVTNAIDACTESETGDLVVVRSRVAEREVVLTIEDNGVGMTEAIRSRLFTRFFSTKGSKGTGLGLSVVDKIVEGHGGRLVVESEPGRGSAFHIHLPRSGDR